MEHFQLSFSSVNCNSLNQASLKEIQEKKLFAILKLSGDIIFLSDTRLSNNSSKDSLTNIYNTLAVNPFASYKAIFNSTKSKRGVGILIKTSCDVTDISVIRSQDENYILALIQHNVTGNKIIVGSVYGPNNLSPEFWAGLEADIRSLGNFPIILGGDWNCTVSTLPVNINPDCFQMTDVPNKRHSELLETLTTRLNLTDPFRFLHPAKSEFTYIPRNRQQLNRSRLDFFLITADIADKILSCEIDNALLSKAFDHKPIHLSFKKPAIKPKFNQNIAFDTINNPDTEIIVKLALIEAYKTNADQQFIRENFRDININNTLGRIWTIMRTIIPDPNFCPEPELDIEKLNDRENGIREAKNLLDSIDIALLQRAPLQCNNTTFYDTLLNNIRNETVSFQSYTRKMQKQYLNSLNEKIRNEKTKEFPNEELLSELEQNLTTYRDQQIENELKKFSLFEFLNEEKITPAFLKLARTGNADKDLSLIVDGTGTPFNTPEERNAYIKDYFASVYREPEPGREVTADNIRNFLGPRIINSRQVQSSILTDQERNSLEGELTILELDQALGEAKTNSASGGDGINYGFLKKFWPLLRVPLHNYALEALNTGTLTDNFRTANIRLIPKKGDITDIKNWRPISLLNCSYKVISRAINNRLKKIFG